MNDSSPTMSLDERQGVLIIRPRRLDARLAADLGISSQILSSVAPSQCRDDTSRLYAIATLTRLHWSFMHALDIWLSPFDVSVVVHGLTEALYLLSREPYPQGTEEKNRILRQAQLLQEIVLTAHAWTDPEVRTVALSFLLYALAERLGIEHPREIDHARLEAVQQGSNHGT